MNYLSRDGWLLAVKLLGFQVAWFACVLGAAHGVPSIGVAAVAAFAAWQLRVSSARSHDAALIALALVMGLAWDTAMARMGIVIYASPGPLPAWAPAWILALWVLLAVTLQDLLSWLHGRWLVAAVVGGVGGALSYAGAVKLGAGRFPDEALAMAVLCLGWALIMPCLTETARWLRQRR